jgi:hypothetical protein
MAEQHTPADTARDIAAPPTSERPSRPAGSSTSRCPRECCLGRARASARSERRLVEPRARTAPTNYRRRPTRCQAAIPSRFRRSAPFCTRGTRERRADARASRALTEREWSMLAAVALSSSTPPIVDCHLHLWDLRRFAYPWMAAPDLAYPRGLPPCRPAPRRRRAPARGAVHVQAEESRRGPRPEDGLVELARLRRRGDPRLVYVADADARAAELDTVLERHIAAGPVRGIRQEAWFDPASTRADIRRTNPLNDRSWRAGLRRLADAQPVIRPARLATAARTGLGDLRRRAGPGRP